MQIAPMVDCYKEILRFNDAAASLVMLPHSAYKHELFMCQNRGIFKQIISQAR